MRSLIYLVLASLIGLTAYAQTPINSNAPQVNTLDIAAYFPIQQGNTWTYDWTFQIGQAPAQTVKRTRAFEGREFTGMGMADKLASENGDYALFALNENGLFLHGAAEMQRDARFVFDPPIAVLTRTMKAGEWLKATQLAEDGKTTREFAAQYEPLADFTTPMGKFADCLKVTWTMNDATQTHRTTYYLARGVGIVAYTLAINLRPTEVQPRPFAMTVDAKLTLAQLQGKTFTQAADVRNFATGSKRTAEDGKARALFRKAHESQYTWDKKFPGVTGEFNFTRDDGAPVTGKFAINRQLQLEVQCADASVKAVIHAELSQIISYRQARLFDELYGADKAQIGFGAIISDVGTTEIIVSDEAAAGASYLLRDREIIRIARSYGRARFVNEVTNRKLEDGRLLATEAHLTYYSNETGATVGQTSYRDRYEKFGAYWLPLERRKEEFAKGKASQTVLLLRNVQYEK